MKVINIYMAKSKYPILIIEALHQTRSDPGLLEEEEGSNAFWQKVIQ